MPADPTPPPVPAEALEAAEFEFCQRFAVASNPEAMTAFRAALAAAAVPLVAAGRTAAAADLAATFERIADSEGQSLLGTPPEYPSERTMRSGRCAAFKRAAEIAREAR